MAETATATEAGIVFTADYDTQRIIIPEINPGGDDQITGDTLRNALRKLGDTNVGMQFLDPIDGRVEGRFAYASDGSVSGFLEFKFRENWAIESQKPAGVFRLVGANVLAPNRSDVFVDDTPSVSYKQFSISGGTAAIVETGVSGLTPTEAVELATAAASTPTANAAAFLAALVEGTFTVQDVLRFKLAMAAGSGQMPTGPGEFNFQSPVTPATTRIAGNVAANGARTVPTANGS